MRNNNGRNTVGFFLTAFLLITALNVYPQSAPGMYGGINLDTVTAQKYDMGKMWTFENPPLDYFKSEYGFEPSAEWLERARKSALKFATYCSASFVSEDGLIMTNHHCARGTIPTVEKEGENFLRDGFFAKTLADERTVKGIFVEQLMELKDVTDEVLSAMNKGTTDEEKVKLREEKIKEITESAAGENSELIWKVTSLYNGGKYSLYGYMRYDDVRLVFAPDLRTAKFGGDPDNFTYPRYGLDCTFFRAYDKDGKPVKSNYYFQWSSKGADEGDVVFVVGNPGSTQRINTIAQIEYARDVQYPMMVKMLRTLYSMQEAKVKENKAEDYQLIARLYSIGNSLKVYEGTYKALNDPYLMARKKDFEKKFREAVNNDPTLKERYGFIWPEIEATRKKAREIGPALFSYNISRFYSPAYFFTAAELVNLAEQLQLPEAERKPQYKSGALEETISKIYPEELNKDEEFQKLVITADILTDNLNADDIVRKEFIGNKTGEAAAEEVLSNSVITTKEGVEELIDKGAEAILSSDDPFIRFIINTRSRISGMQQQMQDIQTSETINNALLGEALFNVFGDAIPPDATFTLRIADGIVKGYDYNGTKAPVKTTFYGVLDRHYGFNKEFPYNLPDMWENLPPEFDLATPYNFISTADIIGGNSGSPVINKEGKIVGLAFDGNIESLPANFIYTTEANRTVSVHSEGMVEAIKDLYKAVRVSDELINGKIPDEYRK